MPLGDARRRPPIEPDADRAVRTRWSHCKPRGLPSGSIWRADGSDRIAGVCRPARAGAAQGRRIAIAVVGAHLAGLPLNGELVGLGAAFLREAKTTADYCLYELAGSRPAKPGLLRVADGTGGPIALEVWTLDAAGFGAFVAKIPPPLGIGTIRLADGSSVKGFLVEAESVAGAKDISKFGGWRAYLAAGASI